MGSTRVVAVTTIGISRRSIQLSIEDASAKWWCPQLRPKGNMTDKRASFDEVFPFEYQGGGYFRRRGVPRGETAEVLHGEHVARFVYDALTAELAAELSALRASLEETRRALSLVTYFARRHAPDSQAAKDVEAILDRSGAALDLKGEQHEGCRERKD